MLNAIAIDDEPIALQIIEKFALKVPFVTLKASYVNAMEALEWLSNHQVDLIFLDIKMPDISGIEFIDALSSPPKLIFTTAYSEFAVQSYELEVVDYLLKPFSFSRFVKACHRAQQLDEANNQQEIHSIFLKTGYEQLRVMLEDILFVESRGNYVQFVLKDKKVMARMSMQEVEGILHKEFFSRVHRCYLVAKNKVNRIQRHQLWINDVAIPIGKSYAENLLNSMD